MFNRMAGVLNGDAKTAFSSRKENVILLIIFIIDDL